MIYPEMTVYLWIKLLSHNRLVYLRLLPGEDGIPMDPVSESLSPKYNELVNIHGDMIH